MRKILLLAALPWVAVAADRPTDHHAHGWLAYFGDHPIAGSRWGAHLEAQVRRHDLGGSWQQLLLRPGVNFQAHPKVMLTVGYGFARSHRYNDNVPQQSPSNEHRIWQQVWFRYGSPGLRWSTRLRFENRFLASRFENRMRAWQQVTVPVSRKLYLTAYDEFWFYVPPYQSNSAFDQNRAYAGIGVRSGSHWRIEAGYLNQTILLRSGSRLEQNHTMMVSIFSDAGLFKRR
jgi:hypothetical protein